LRIKQLDIENIRVLEQVSLQCDTSFVHLYGRNGSGKTSVLEAISVLATGQSFRTQQARHVIRHEQEYLRVRASLVGDSSSEDNLLAIERTRSGSTTIRHNRQEIKRLSEVSAVLPVRSIAPDSHELISGSSSLRRRYVDWGVFHVEQAELFPWRDYNRLLDQRNALLKTHWNPEIMRAIDHSIAPLGEAISLARARYIERISHKIPAILASLDADFDVSLKHSRGWNDEMSLTEALDLKIDQCRKMKTTTVGPHRADLRIHCGSALAKDTMSRGQQKLMLYALLLAQVTDFSELHGAKMVLLCDDLRSELDATRAEILTSRLLSQGHQLFVTGTDKPSESFGDSVALFHVEQGVVL